MGEIAGMVAMIAGIYAAIENISREIAARELAKREAAKEAGKAYIQQSLTEQLFDYTVSSIKDMGFSGYTKITGYVNQVCNFIYENQMKDIETTSGKLAEEQRELEQSQLLSDDQGYILSRLAFMSYNMTFKSLVAMNEKYYNTFEGIYDRAGLTIIKAGPFKPIGVFNPSYAEQTSLEMRKRS
jgi:hypothetical protein